MGDIDYDILATGRPYTDLITTLQANRPLPFLGFKIGTNCTVSAGQLTGIIGKLESYTIHAGGSPSNTCAVVRALGGRAAFVGKICDDQAGKLFRQTFTQIGVHFPTEAFHSDSESITGTCVIFKHAGTETMLHCPGVGDILSDSDFPKQLISRSKILYIQSHLLFCPTSREAVTKAIKLARTAGRQIAFSLHDHQMDRDRANSFISHHLKEDDILLGNYQEFQQVIGEPTPGSKAILVRTNGNHGADIFIQKTKLHIDALEPDVIQNTIGAGDAFAAGFLYGYSKNLSLELAARLGAEASRRIMAVSGGRPEEPWLDLAI